MRVIHVLRKPLSEGTVAANVLKHGTGGLNIDASRIPSDGSHMVHGTVRRGDGTMMADRSGIGDGPGMFAPGSTVTPTNHAGGRWPANVILQHLDGCRRRENICEPGCPVARLDEQSGERPSGGSATKGGVSRFFKQIGSDSDG